MKILKCISLAACLFTAAGAASATTFTTTTATFGIGTGYGIDASEATNVATLLDVRFSNGNFAAPSFALNTVGDFYDFVVGTVSFQESNNSQGILTSETDNLGVSLALAFTAPGNFTNTLLATGTALIGSVPDTALDYTLTWAPLTATFGTGGMYAITFATLAFDGVGTQNLVARVTLISAATTPPVNVPEPGSVALLAIGMLGAGVLRRRASK